MQLQLRVCSSFCSILFSYNYGLRVCSCTTVIWFTGGDDDIRGFNSLPSFTRGKIAPGGGHGSRSPPHWDYCSAPLSYLLDALGEFVICIQFEKSMKMTIIVPCLVNSKARTGKRTA